jgi:hypothetical protein
MPAPPTAAGRIDSLFHTGPQENVISHRFSAAFLSNRLLDREEKLIIRDAPGRRRYFMLKGSSHGTDGQKLLKQLREEYNKTLGRRAVASQKSSSPPVGAAFRNQQSPPAKSKHP